MTSAHRAGRVTVTVIQQWSQGTARPGAQFSPSQPMVNKVQFLVVQCHSTKAGTCDSSCMSDLSGAPCLAAQLPCHGPAARLRLCDTPHHGRGREEATWAWSSQSWPLRWEVSWHPAGQEEPQEVVYLPEDRCRANPRLQVLQENFPEPAMMAAGTWQSGSFGHCHSAAVTLGFSVSVFSSVKCGQLCLALWIMVSFNMTVTMSQERGARDPPSCCTYAQLPQESWYCHLSCIL
jgi:hypothetical protein